MLLGGDEQGRSQGGNNNAWCQDTEISWFDWDPDSLDLELQDFTQRLLRLRREHPVFRRRAFLRGAFGEAGAVPDAWWFGADGRRMTRRKWEDGNERVVGLFLNGDRFTERGPQGEAIRDDSFLVLVNGWEDEVRFALPSVRFGRHWTFELGTADAVGASRAPGRWRRAQVACPGRSLTVLRRR